MDNYKNLYKLIDGLNNKIKKLENNKIRSQSIIESYRIHYPKENLSNKKYIGLLFDNNINNFDCDNNSDEKPLSSFIKLKKSNILINYYIQLELDSTPLSSVICSISIGIKTKSESKIKIIKGTKQYFDLSNNLIINNRITISNTIVYMSDLGEELCIIGEFNSCCIPNSKKSLLKIFYI